VRGWEEKENNMEGERLSGKEKENNEGESLTRNRIRIMKGERLKGKWKENHISGEAAVKEEGNNKR
jgi:hypothetical protein